MTEPTGKESAYNNEWYTNRQLFEMIVSMQKQMHELITEMKMQNKLSIQLKDQISNEYTNLHSRMKHVEEAISKAENRSQGKSSVAEGIRLWGAWLIAAAALAYSVFFNRP